MDKRIRIGIKELTALLFTLVILLMPTFSLAHQRALPDAVSVDISVQETNIAGWGEIRATFTLTNTSDETLRILKRGTILEDKLRANVLHVSRNGAEVDYLGPDFKRLPPTEDDFLTLAGGASTTVSRRLDRAYDFSKVGNYQIRYAGTRPPKDGSWPELQILIERPFFKQTPNYRSCTATQQSQANSALGAAESLANRARSSLRNTPLSLRPQAELYIQWFGVYDLARWNRVQTNFDRIFSAASQSTITFDCACSEGDSNTYAYVYPSSPYNIYLCPLFWGRPNSGGADSKAGIIIHELSHFSNLADTDDYVYGTSGSRSLAATRPEQAIRNADNYEYFAENPFGRSMPTAGGSGGGDTGGTGGNGGGDSGGSTGGDPGGGVAAPPTPEPEPDYSYLSNVINLLLDLDVGFQVREELPDTTITPISESIDGRYELSILSEPGEQVGQGQELSYDQTNSNLSITLNSKRELQILLNGWGKTTSRKRAVMNWEITLTSLSGGNLRSGVFLEGVKVTSNLSGCGRRAGGFRIYELETQAGQVTRLLADFEQHCNLKLPKLMGTIDYDVRRQSALVDYTLGPTPPAGDELPTVVSNKPRVVLEGVGENFFNLEGKQLFDESAMVQISQDKTSTRETTDITIVTSRETFELSFSGSTLDADVNQGLRLEPGHFPFGSSVANDSPAPQLELRRNGLSCQDGYGFFTVHNIEFEVYWWVPSSLELTFEYHCPGLSGHIKGGIKVEQSLPNPPTFEPDDIASETPPVFPSLTNAGAVVAIDRTGDGNYRTFESTTSNIEVSSYVFFSDSRLSVTVEGEPWTSMRFETASGVVNEGHDRLLRPGIYGPAINGLSPIPAEFPSMSGPFTSGCTQQAGYYRVFASEYDELNRLLSIKMDFRWVCEDGVSGHGMLIYDSTLPPHEYYLEPVTSPPKPELPEPVYAGGEARFTYGSADWSFSNEHANFTITPSYDGNYLSIQAESLSGLRSIVRFWPDRLDVYPQTSQPISPGVYRPSINGLLQFQGYHPDPALLHCTDPIDPVARIHEINFEEGEVTRLVADFQITCTNTGKKKRFSIRYNANLDPFPFPPRPAPTGQPRPTLPDVSGSVVRLRTKYLPTGDVLSDQTYTDNDATLEFEYPRYSWHDRNYFKFSVSPDTGYGFPFQVSARRPGLHIDPDRLDPFYRGVYEMERSSPITGQVGWSFYNCERGTVRIFRSTFSETTNEYDELRFDAEIICESRQRLYEIAVWYRRSP